MDLETFRWLLTDDGQRLLARAAAALTDDTGDSLGAAERVRRHEPDPDRRAAALLQAELRVQAREKLGADASAMYFTRDGLEQATRKPVADHRARRLAQADPGAVVDLGCGVGSDLLAVARTGVIAAGVDTDPVRVAIAEANLAALGLGGAVTTADATTMDLSPFGAVFCDPSRRDATGRVFDPDAWSPAWDFITGLLRHTAVVKCAPGLPHDRVPPGVEAEWVSDAGALTEAVLWSPNLATVRRRASVLTGGRVVTLTEEDDPWHGADAAARPVREVGAYCYEPDPAVIRAGLVTAVAAGVEGGLLDPHLAYVTSDRELRTPFARTYRVVEELPYREKQLRAALRERGIGPLTIKKRGVEVEPEQLRRRLGLTGDRDATVVLTRVAGEGRALLVEPA